MSTISDRIVELIETTNGLTKSKFATGIGVSAAFVSQLCSGVREPSDRTIADICRVYDVNEQWLRTGEGEMLVKLTPSEELAIFTAQLQKEDSFRRRFVAALSTLEPEDWVKIQEFVDKLANKTTNPE